jgi:hypothetical protein
MYKEFSRGTFGENPLGIPRRGWEDNIKQILEALIVMVGGLLCCPKFCPVED